MRGYCLRIQPKAIMRKRVASDAKKVDATSMNMKNRLWSSDRKSRAEIHGGIQTRTRRAVTASQWVMPIQPNFLMPIQARNPPRIAGIAVNKYAAYT